MDQYGCKVFDLLKGTFIGATNLLEIDARQHGGDYLECPSMLKVEIYAGTTHIDTLYQMPPPRLSSIQILKDDRVPVLNFFLQKKENAAEESSEREQIEFIVDVLRNSIDPIASLEYEYWRKPAERPLYLVALEMFYMIRHQLETAKMQDSYRLVESQKITQHNDAYQETFERCKELIDIFIAGAAYNGSLFEVDTYHIWQKMRTISPIQQWISDGVLQEEIIQAWITQAVKAAIKPL